MRSNENGSNKLTYLAGDHHGTMSLAINADATQTLTKRYMTPFGAERGKPTGTTWPDDKGFLGKTEDKTTGLTHIGAREYDPAIGQFISVDPLLVPNQPQSLNGYSYANNSPVTLTDPTGLAPICGSYTVSCSTPIGAITGGVGHAVATGSSGSGGGTHNGGDNGGCTAAAQYRGDCGKIITSGFGPSVDDELSAAAPYFEPTIAEKVLDGMGAVADMGLWEIGKALVLPDTEEWKACWDDFGINSHCGWAATDLPTPMKAIGWARKLFKLSKKAKEVPCTCFVAGTDVLMADGTTKDIEKVELGDKVLAADPETGERQPREVTRLIRTEDDKYFNTLSIASADGVDEVTATYEHPFWSPSQKSWIEAGDLTPGMTLLTDDGDTVLVTANRPFTQHARTYNLTVDDLHTYYVLAGETPVLVHNANSERCPTGYENPGHHDPHDGPNAYNPKKGVLPADAEEQFQNSVLVNGVRWTKIGTGKKAVYYRYSDNGHGQWHWSGSSNGRDNRGNPVEIPMEHIPIQVRRG